MIKTPLLTAYYFDGIEGIRHEVTVLLHKGLMMVRGPNINRAIKLSALTVSEELEHAPRILAFPDGARLEMRHQHLNKILRANGYKVPRIVLWQKNWSGALVALILVVILFISGYQWGMPWVADQIAQHLPISVDKNIGQAELAILEEQFLERSTLNATEQTRLRKLFSGLKQPNNTHTTYQLEFRNGNSKIGPNAFALPDGTIVVTDQLVTLAGNDQAIMSVLAHELGHVQHRHSLRRLLQATGVAFTIDMFIGDVSSTLTALPTLLLDQKYSRDFEREADQYAISMMRANHIPLLPMIELFGKMHAQKNNTSDQNKLIDYLSSHPNDAERIQKLQAEGNQ